MEKKKLSWSDPEYRFSAEFKERFGKRNPRMEQATKKMEEGLDKIAKAIEDGKLRPFILHPEIF